MMTTEDLKNKLARLKEEHRALDAEIAVIREIPRHDQLALQRLKKKKLKLKDEILRTQAKLLPDIIA
jgi:hypothetical protein